MESNRGTRPLPVDGLARALLEGFEEAVLLLDGAGRLVCMNRQAALLSGFSEEERRGQRMLLEPELDASVEEAPEFLIPRAGRARIRRKDGSDAPVRFRSTPVRVEGAELELLRLESMDAAEASVCTPKAAVDAIVDTITDGVIVIDEAGLIDLFNPAAERQFGYRRDEVIGRNVKMLMPAAYGDRHDEVLGNYRRTGVPKIIGIGRELVGRRKDGTVFPINLSVGELCQEGRRVFVGIVHDLSRRKEAEEKLMVLHRAVDQSPVAMMIVDLEGQIEYVNQGFCRLTGYCSLDLLGSNPRRSPSGQAGPDLYQRLWASIQAGEERQGEILDRKKSGERYCAMETVTAIRDVEGRITRYLAIQQDISEQKRDREALHESEGRFRQVADMVGEWLWEQDAGGRYTYCSGAVLGILGYRPEEIVGRHYLELLTEEDRRHWMETLPADQESARPFFKLINRYRHRDGDEIYTESSGAPLFDETGRLVKWRGVDLDITERKRFEDELRLRERAIEAASVGIVIADARRKDYPNIYVNPAICRITGYAREELLGRSLSMLQGPETDSAAVAAIRDALREGKGCEVVLRNYRKSGAPFWNELLLSPVRDPTGTVSHYIGIQADVTERRRAEEERHELEIAKTIQLSLLPKGPLRTNGIEIAGVCLPATHVGGDYFDYFTHGKHVDVVIADVSGHSVGAALIMAEMRSTLKAETRKPRNGRRAPRIGETLRALNELLYADLSGAELFITMFYLRYEPETRTLRYANAGHNRALLLRKADLECEQLDAEGLILGVRREVAFEEQHLALQSGDRVLLYTDGMIEAQNERGEFFGLKRLCSGFRAQRSQPPEAVVRMLLEDLRVFCGEPEFTDDISMVVVQVG